MDSLSAKELFVLGRISIRPTHGHEIMRTLYASRSDLWVDVSRKHVYYIVRKLERDGLITAEEMRDGNLPARKVYSITEPGRIALRKGFTTDSLVRSIPYSDFDVVFGMLAYTDVLLDSEKDAVVEGRDRYLCELITDARRVAAEAADLAAGASVQAVILGKVARMAEAERAWLSDVRAQIVLDGWAALKPPLMSQPPSESIPES